MNQMHTLITNNNDMTGFANPNHPELIEFVSMGYKLNDDFSITGNKGGKMTIGKQISGYCRVQCALNKHKRRFLLHRIIALVHIPNPENKPQVNHINGIKTDNRVENLEWCTAKENAQHAHRTGLATSSHMRLRKGSRNSSSKPVAQMKDGIIIRVFESVSIAAEEIGKNATGIFIACKAQGEGRVLTRAGYEWKYI